MTKFPKYEVAISDADRADIEAMFIELMRERAALDVAETVAIPNHVPKHPGAH